jgi:hypothetical protein
VRIIADIVTLAGNEVNEDRAGASGTLVWVIDGATDVVERPLTTGRTDASWIAETLDALIRHYAIGPQLDLPVLPAMLAERLQSEFGLVADRQPVGRHEHPSASGMIVNVRGDTLNYVGVGDCSLLLRSKTGIHRIGISEDDAGDQWVRDELTAIRREQADASAETACAHLWAKLRAARAAMNQPDGYGVLSLTPPPSHFIMSGSEEIAAGDHALLASDGLMRLVDVFRIYTAEQLLLGAVNQGVSSLAREVRELEQTDSECARFPRAKCHDDATGILLTFSSAD